MHIAIFGATSQIAKDLVQSFAAHSAHQLSLFARNPQVVTQWLQQSGLAGLEVRHQVYDFSQVPTDAHFDAILNFVGVGNPAQAQAMGASIFEVTLQYDAMALQYLQKHPTCRYIFLSSGAAYGSDFDAPVDAHTRATFALNQLQAQDWYGVAKLHAECRHRALAHLPIVDIRVFNYFSHTQDMSARFLITDIFRAIASNSELRTSPLNIVRDYLGPDDFYQLVQCILDAPATNTVVDCYTQAPVEKTRLLSALQERYGLQYSFTDSATGVNATGYKKNYFSTNHCAQQFGYRPCKSSLDSIFHEFDISLRKNAHASDSNPARSDGSPEHFSGS